jgi:hypothetical protein
MAYSAMNNEEGEDESSFSSGGAIMDALAQNDPSLKQKSKSSKSGSKSAGAKKKIV